MKTYTKKINSSYKGERFLRDLGRVNLIASALVLREAHFQGSNCRGLWPGLGSLGLQSKVESVEQTRVFARHGSESSLLSGSLLPYFMLQKTTLPRLLCDMSSGQFCVVGNRIER